MSVIDEARTRLRSREGQGEPWRAPEPGDLAADCPVLTWDATLSHCGWAVIQARDWGIQVYARGCINPVTELTGYMGTWDKARQLRSEIETNLIRFPDVHRVIEAPAVHGSRTESSLIAGMLIWHDDPRRTTVVSATHVSAVLLGDPKVRSSERKKRIREAVIRLVPEAAGRGWNEHQRDAVATGLTYLYDLRRTDG